MKVFNFFVHIFAIFSFLTLGSLLMIVALHILALEDAILRVREIYANPWLGIQTGFLGLLFITVGLTFTKLLVKKGREQDAVIVQSEIGPIVVSANAIEDAVKKVLKRFNLVKDSKIKTLIRGKDVEIQIRLVLWAGGNVPELLEEIQGDVFRRIQKLLGESNKLEVSCDVQRIQDYETDKDPVERDEPMSV